MRALTAAAAYAAGEEAPLPADFEAAVEAALASDPALRVGAAEELRPEFEGPEGEALQRELRVKPQDAYRGPPAETPPGGAADGAYSERFKRDVRALLRGTVRRWGRERERERI